MPIQQGGNDIPTQSSNERLNSQITGDTPNKREVITIKSGTDSLAQLREAGLIKDGQPLRLHLGCGEQHFDGYVNIDYPPTEHNIMKVKADICANLTELDFPDESVDEIRLHHVFEHFNRVTALAMLIRWHKWLKIGGKLHIETPDLIGSAKTLLTDSSWTTKMGIVRHVVGDQSASWAYHIDHWFPERFEHTLQRLGFTDIQTKSTSWPHEPFLSNVEVIAIKSEDMAIERQLQGADELLWESTVSPSEKPTYEVWKAQLRAVLGGNSVPPPANTQLPDMSSISQSPIVNSQAATHLPIDEIHDFNQRSRDLWIQQKAKTLPQGSHVLDVGAGTCPYRQLFAHCEYKAHDFKKYTGEKLGGTTEYGNIDYASEITNIPVPDNSFDLILCTEVLEHVPEPIEALREMARIIKPGGRILLTAPLGSGLHQLPYHFYGGYTPEWYKYFAPKMGLDVAEITPNGGFFKLLAQECARVAGTFQQHQHLHGDNAKFIYNLFSEFLPRYLFAMEDKCFIDQFTVGYHVELVKGRQTGKGMNQDQNTSSAPLKSQHGLSAVVFSKDRPLQLEGTLRSFFSHCKDADKVTLNVLYKSSTPVIEAFYQRLSQEYHSIEFVREKSFKADLLRLIDNSEYILFLVDDNIFIKDFNVKDVTDALSRHQDAVGFSLRLGKNTNYCYPLNKPQNLPTFHEIGGELLKFDWTSAELDFNYPLEVSSSVYRTKDIIPLLNSLDVKNPNTLEALIAANTTQYREHQKNLLCFKQSVTFCAPLNMVQDVCNNRIGGKPEHSAEELLKLFSDGYRIDTAAYPGFTPNACHQEVELKLYKKEARERPAVSVVIPCYNQAQFLHEAVESVVNQTFTDWECIIVNDGSPDNTREVAEQLIERYKDKRIRLINQQNQGLARSRNNGIAASSGRYILPLDSDDKLHPEMLQRAVSLLEANPEIAIAYTDLIHFGAANRLVQAAEYNFNLLRHQNHLNYCSLYRREAWDAAGGYNPNMTWGYEDWDFWIGCGEKGYIAKRIPDPLLFYRVKDSSMYTKALEHDRELRAHIILNHPNLYDQKDVKEAKNMSGRNAEQDSMTGPMVSVIVPTHNRPEMLVETLKSILKQTYKNLEIIVVNDAGSDVAEVIKSLDHSGKIVYIKHPLNKGLAAARNTGIKAARGKYIAYLDDDDLFYPDHLETLVSSLKKSDYKVAYTDAHRAYQEIKDGKYIVTKRDVPYSYDFDYDRILVTNFVPVLCFMHEKSCMDEVGPFDESLKRLEDWDMWIRLSRKFRFHHIRKITCEFNWRTDGSTMTSGKDSEFVTARKAIAEKYSEPVKQISTPASNVMPLSMKKSLVSIIILTYNQLKYTKECVESIRKHTPEPHEVIFVDNGSKDGTVKWLKQLVKDNANYKLIENKKNLGFAKGCNQGISASSGEYMLLLNNDVLVTEGWLAGMLECHNNSPDVGITGPMTNNISGPQKVENVGYASVSRLADYAKTFRERNRHRRIPIRRVVGFCMLFKRELVEKIGLLDESFGSGNFEDDDYCLRAALEGYKNMIAGDVFIHHYGSMSFKGNRIDYGSAMARNNNIFTAKWSSIDVNTAIGKKVLALKALEKAQEHYHKEELDAAIQTLLEGIVYAPDEKATYQCMTEVLIAGKRFKEAEDIINSIPEDIRNDARTLELSGYCKEGMELYNEAEELADRVLSINPNSAPALNLKGRLAFKKDDNKTAGILFSKAMESDPALGEPYFSLGELKWSAGQKEDALTYIEKGFILSPAMPDMAILYYSSATDTGNIERAEQLFRDAKAIYPLNKGITFLLIDLLIRQGKNDEAMQGIEDALMTFGMDDGMLKAALEIRDKVGAKRIEGTPKNSATLSLCMIVKNEEKYLAKCLMSIKSVADEMIVVDTGSSDRTKEIAKAFGAEVYDFEWKDDFADARNFSLSKAKGDWIFILDADERISSLDHRLFSEIVKKRPIIPAAYSITTRNYIYSPNITGWVANDGKYISEEAGTGWNPTNKVRLFPNDNRIRYEYPVHEMVEPSLGRLGIKIIKSDIQVHHYGKLDTEKVTSKGKKYLVLGEKKLENNSGDAKSLFELAVQAGEIHDFQKAVDLWQRLLNLNTPEAKVFHLIAYINLGNAYIGLGKFEDAFEASEKALELDPNSESAVTNYALSVLWLGDPRKAIPVLENMMLTRPDYPPAIGILSAAYLIEGKMEAGVEYLDKIKKMGYDGAAYLLDHANKLVSAGRIDSAISLLEAAIESRNVNNDILSLLSECRKSL